MFEQFYNLTLHTILHIKFASICKCKRSFPNYLVRVGLKNFYVRKLDDHLKGVRD